MKKCWLGLGLVLALATGVVAQRAGMELEGFRVPEYNDDGTMQSQLFGSRAVLKEDGLVDITDLKIEFYQTGKSNVVLTAPECTYNRNTKDAESDGPVKIEMQEMTVTGRGFVGKANDYQFTILHDAKVVLKDVRLGMKGKEQ